MPGSFSGFGVHFLYPENWKIAEQSESEDVPGAGVTLETPDGAFFSVNRYGGVNDPRQVIDEAVSAMRGEYENVEANAYEVESFPDDAGAELSFYYLDLLISARMLAILDRGDVLLVQMQGENRDFDRLEPVFDAMVKSLRDSLE